MVDLLQPLDARVGVDLRGGDRGVSEQLLHRAKIRPCVEQMGCERVSERVSRQT